MSFVDALSVALAVAVALAGLSLVVHGLKVGIAPMPSSLPVRQRLRQVLSPDEAGLILELGSGFGGLAFLLADHCPKAQVVAYESSLFPFAVSAVRQRLWPRPNLTLRRKDFLTLNLSEASLVVCFLSTGLMAKLEPKLRRELSAAARVVSVTFALRGWQPERVDFADDLFRSPIYHYKLGGSAPSSG